MRVFIVYSVCVCNAIVVFVQFSTNIFCLLGDRQSSNPIWCCNRFTIKPNICQDFFDGLQLKITFNRFQIDFLFSHLTSKYFLHRFHPSFLFFHLFYVCSRWFFAVILFRPLVCRIRMIANVGYMSPRGTNSEYFSPIQANTFQNLYNLYNLYYIDHVLVICAWYATSLQRLLDEYDTPRLPFISIWISFSHQGLAYLIECNKMSTKRKRTTTNKQTNW